MADTKALAPMERPAFDLAKYSPDQYNVLAPVSMVGRDVDYMQVSGALVKLDPDPNKGDCYAAPGTRWERNEQTGELLPIMVAPAKPGLMKLAAAMGIVWRVEQIKPRSHQLVADMAQAVGPAGCKELFEQVRYDVAYRAQIAVRDGLGWRFLEATYEWELESQTRKVKRDARKKVADAIKYKKAAVDEEQYVADRVDQIISDRFALAESKAILRAIRATGIRQHYERHEFGKPFVVQRVDLRPDTTDPAVRAAIAAKAVQSGSEIFGGGQSSAAPVVHVQPTEVPDFDTAEREGKIERVAPGPDEALDVGVLPEAQPASDEWPADDAPGPWAEQPASNGAPNREMLLKRVYALYAKAQQAGIAEKLPVMQRDADASALADWCAAAEEALKTKGGAQ